MVSPSASEVDTDEIEEWPQQERLAQEKDLLGFYVTGHPLDAYRMSFRKGGFRKLAQMENPPDKPEQVKFAGLIDDVAIKYSKRGGKPFAIIFLEDFSGTKEIVVFGETYANNAKLLQKGSVLQFKGAWEKDRRAEGTLRFSVQEMSVLKAIPYDPAEFEKGQKVEAPIEPLELVLDASTDSVSDLRRIHAIATSHRGRSPLRLRVHNPGEADQVILTHQKYWINATPEAKSDLAQWLNA